MTAATFELKLFPSSTSSTAAESMNGAAEHVGIGAAERVGIGAEEHAVPIVEVAFKHGLWWSLPQAMSGEIYEKYINGQDAVYTGDWGDTRDGSWMPDGEVTRINRYRIDFVNFVQTNMDNQRKRSIRIVWVRSRDVVPQFTGEIPEGHLSEQ